jgi:hypothetical protein
LRPARPLALAAAGVLMLAAACRQRHIVGEITAQGGGVDGSTGMSSCGTFASGDDLRVCAASYLSGRGAEAAASVDLAPDGTLLVAGSDEGVDFGTAPVALLGGGNGTLFRLRADGHAVLSLTRIGTGLVDMEVDPSSGRIAVAGPPFGVASLQADGAAVAWTAAGAADRVSAGGGLVATLGAGMVSVFDAGGAALGRFAVTSDVALPSDVAVHPATQSVMVVGWSSAGAVDQPVLASYAFSGTRRWLNWGWAAGAAVAAGVPAPSRAVRVATGRDGKIYVLGQAEGGDTVFTKLPRDLAQPAPNVVIDDYSSISNAGNAILAYVARIDPGNGNLEVGQFLVTRDAANGNRAQDLFPGAVAADEHGTVIVGGSLLCCLDRQSQKTFAGAALAPAVPDAFLAILAVDFVSRIAWTTMGTGGAATVVGVALAARTGALVALQDPAESARGPLITVDPLQPAPAGGGADTYFAVFPTP